MGTHPSDHPAEEAPDKVAALTETLQRLQAEFENYRKRMEKEQKAYKEQATKTLLLHLLPIIDHFELALHHPKTDDEFRKGVELIFHQFMETLQKEGLRPIPEQQTFDPALHEPLMQEEADQPTGTIIEIFQKGYMLNGKIIRQAKVKVSK